MRLRPSAFALVALVGLISTGRASAQAVLTSYTVVAPNASISPSYTYPVPSYGAPRLLQGGVYAPVYDYFAAPYPLPARIYAGYGKNDFPFYGQVYGHPYEPFTWAGMSRYPGYPTRISGFVGP